MTDLFDLAMAGRLSGGGSPAPEPTLITKTITANGTYSAEDDGADGYSAVTAAVPQGIPEHDVMEGIWANDAYQSSVPSELSLAIDHNTLADTAAYLNAPSQRELRLRPTAIDAEHAPRTLCAIILYGNSSAIYKRTAPTGLFPNTRSTIYTAEIAYGEGEAIIDFAGFGTIHPSAAKTGIRSKVWFNKAIEKFRFAFPDIFTLSGQNFTGGEQLLFVATSSSEYDLWLYPSGTVFSQNGGNISGNKAANVWKMPSSSYFSSSVHFAAKKSVSKDNYTYNVSVAVSNILCSTFDLKLADETVIYAKNANVSDFVDLT